MESSNSGDLVTAKQMNDLREDIMKCWHHITSDDFVLPSVSTTDEVEAVLLVVHLVWL